MYANVEEGMNMTVVEWATQWTTAIVAAVVVIGMICIAFAL
jgi:hypothetical protein